jgi:hypothetical protein
VFAYRSRIAQVADCNQVRPLAAAGTAEALDISLLLYLPNVVSQLLEQRCAKSREAKAEEGEKGIDARPKAETSILVFPRRVGFEDCAKNGSADETVAASHFELCVTRTSEC